MIFFAKSLDICIHICYDICGYKREEEKCLQKPVDPLMTQKS